MVWEREGLNPSQGGVGVLAHGRLLLYFTHNYLLFYARQ